MLHALQAYQADHSFTVEVVDVDANEDLVAQYDELVPVLVGMANGTPAVQICHYFLDKDKVEQFLNGGVCSS